MRVLVEDLQTFGVVRHLDLAAYLRARGWKEVEFDDSLGTWERGDGDDAINVLLPKKPTWRDYARRVRDVVRTLGDLEGRSEEIILREVAQVSADVIRLHASAPGLRDGSIPLGNALELNTAARGMLLAAACAAEEPRRAYHTRKTTRAVQYIDSLKVGQTERGSFVLAILSSVPPSLAMQGQEPLPAVDVENFSTEPFQRRVTKTLTGALPLVVRAAEEGIASGSLDAFEHAISRGVSADLCDAIAGLPHVDSVSVSVSWAPSRPVRESAGTPVIFTPDLLEVIAEAGVRLREREPVEDFRLLGPVQKLDRAGDEKRGTVQVLGTIDGRPRKVLFDLSGEDWDLAHNAINSRAFISCKGELLKHGKTFHLANPRDLSLVTADDA